VGDIQKLKFFLQKSRLVLEANDFGYSCVHFAAAYGRCKVLETLLKAGADPNALNRKNDVTPLHLAAAFGHAECVKALLEHGADHRLLTTR
jgi:ankyrin repeat protein